MGNPRELWLLVEGFHVEIWAVSETRIHMEIQGKFLHQGWNEKEVSPNLSTFQFTKEWHKIITGIFLHNWDPSYVIKLQFEIFEGSTREISMWKYRQGFHRERRQKYPHRKYPSFPLNFRREIMRKFPQGWSHGIPLKSAWKSGGRGWLARWVMWIQQLDLFQPLLVNNLLTSVAKGDAMWQMSCDYPMVKLEMLLPLNTT